MADDTSIHKVVEKLEVEGFDKVDRAFQQLAAELEPVDKKLTKIRKGLGGKDFGALVFDQDYERSKALQRKAIEEQAAAQTKSLGKALLINSAIEYGVRKARDLAAQAWDTAAGYERARNRIQGLVQGLSNFGHASGETKAERSQAMAAELMKDYRKIALETATSLEQIEAAGSRINPVLSGLGKTQAEVTEETRLSAAAAKIYGERAEEAGKIVAKAIATGAVEGEGPFAMAFKSMAKLDSKMTIDKRMEKANKVLRQMGAPLDYVTRGTDSAIQRWKTLSEDILARTTKPAYDAIGERIAKIVSYTKDHDAAVDSAAGKVDKLVRVYSSLEGGVISALKAASDLDAKLDKFLYGDGDSPITAFIKGIGDGLDLAGKGLDFIGATVSGVLTGKWERWDALMVGIQVKTREVALDILGIVRSVSHIAGINWVGKAFGVDDKLAAVEAAIQKSIDERTDVLRGLELAAGMEGSTDATAKAIELEKSKAAKAAREAIERQKGIVVNQNIGNVIVNQDLRGEDPDAIMVEFVRDLEKLGERAFQSTVGGASTVFGPGGA